MNGFIYTIRRFKIATALNFIGLVTAFVAYYLLMTQVEYNGNYNKGIEGYEDVYRLEVSGSLGEEYQVLVNRAVCEEINSDKYSQVEGVYVLGYPRTDYFVINNENVKIEYNSLLRGSLKALGTHIVDGQPDASAPNACELLMPASMAKKYFGRVDVVGEEVAMLNTKEKVKIAGVYEDFPANSSFKNRIYVDMGDENKDNLTSWCYSAFVRMKPGASTEPLVEGLKKLTGQYEEGRFYKFRFVPIADTYMSGTDVGGLDKGSEGMLIVLQLSCLLILIVAVINFANFTLAEAPSCVKSITTHKMLGCGEWSLRIELILEGVITSIAALIAAIGCIATISQFPSICELVNGSMALADNLHIVAQLLGIAFGIGVVSTLYPAFYLTSFPLVTIMKSSFAATPKGLLFRKILIGVQFILSTILVCFFAITYLQKYYIINSDYGYDKEEVLYVEFDPFISQESKLAIKEDIKKIPGVEGASLSETVLGKSDLMMSWGRVGRGEDEIYHFRCLPVDCDFIRVYGINIVDGRDFREGDRDVMIVNESMVRTYPSLRLNESLGPNDDEVIIGVCDNPRVGTVHSDNSNSPAVFIIMGDKYADWGDRWTNINIRVGKNVDKVKVMHEIESMLAKFWVAGAPECHFVNQDLDIAYKEDLIFMQQITIFSIMALVITLIGVFCLTMFETEYRRKEIAIRKVLGCSEEGIILLLLSHYLVIFVVAFAIAVPIAWKLGSEWLTSFAEHTPIYWWIFPMAFFIIAIVLVLTIVIQSWRVATMNPMDSVKME